MPENYAAQLDENGDVAQIIVIPESADPETYCNSLGFSGTWKACPQLPRLGDHYLGGKYYTPWAQVPGAGLGPDGAENGYPVEFEVWKDGAVWVSRMPNNVNEPLANGSPSTWSRADGTYVTPAGWQYQVGEELQEDGTWFRVSQATSFAPSASPAQYVEITGPGGDPAVTSSEWTTGVAYSIGDEVTYNGATYRCTQAHTSIAGWTPTAVPALWEAV